MPKCSIRCNILFKNAFADHEMASSFLHVAEVEMDFHIVSVTASIKSAS